VVNKDSIHKLFNTAICVFAFALFLHGQTPAGCFKNLKMEGFDVDVDYYELVVERDGSLVATTSFIFSVIQGNEVNLFYEERRKKYGIKNEKNVYPSSVNDRIKTLDQSNDGFLFFVTSRNEIAYEDDQTELCDLPPFYFPPKGEDSVDISKIWIDNESNLYIGARTGKFYVIPHGASRAALTNYKLGHDKDSNLVILSGELPVKKVSLGVNAKVCSFAEGGKDSSTIYIGTNNGLFTYNKLSGEIVNLFAGQDSIGAPITITHMQAKADGNIWFSTLEKGMGLYYYAGKKITFYPYPKKEQGNGTLYPIQTFCVKSQFEIFVAVADSLPAIFNINARTYKFINDPSFAASTNKTTDIKLDKAGTLFIVKGGLLYSCSTFDNVELAATNTDSTAFVPFITAITYLDHTEIASIDFNPQDLNKLKLRYDEASFVIYYNVNYSGSKKIQFRWRAEGYKNDWFVMPVLKNSEGMDVAYFRDLKPGKYLLQVQVKIGDGEWSKGEARVNIVITPPFWQTWWFWTLVGLFNIGVIGLFFWWRINVVKRRERERFAHEKEVLELEAKALRAQMNPHFIFNCMNSMKSLIQRGEVDNAVNYLTTFSKLLRVVLNNCDKREITLYDELETSLLYVQLESLRFDNKYAYEFNIDKAIDIKSIMVPALITQPFIENAIWHGLMPKQEGGKLTVTVKKEDEKIYCFIEDDGIGREVSKQNKFTGSGSMHQSKGMHLTQTRLNLDNLLNERNASVEIIDKKDENGNAAGTSIILAFSVD
jgi:hypothetical protein